MRNSSMSYSTLKKKLQPAKKALKHLTKSFKSKLHSFSFTKTLHLIKAKSHHLLSYCSRHLYQNYCINNKNTKNRYRKSSNFSPVYLDQFYSAPAALEVKGLQWRRETSSRGRNMEGKSFSDKAATEEKGKEKMLNIIEDKWREVVAKSPQLRPVDDRAEEFICNFRRDMRLQKEKSILDFQEMLARGT